LFAFYLLAAAIWYRPFMDVPALIITVEELSYVDPIASILTTQAIIHYHDDRAPGESQFSEVYTPSLNR
jgi:hypothetical protein